MARGSKSARVPHARCGVKLRAGKGGYKKQYGEDAYVFESATLPALEARLAAIGK